MKTTQSICQVQGDQRQSCRSLQSLS